MLKLCPICLAHSKLTVTAPRRKAPMGFRFYRRIRIIPGVTLNVSKSGVSTSVGVKGAHVTLGHGQERTTVGIPGSGISYTATSGSKRSHATSFVVFLFLVLALAFWLS